MKKLSILLAMIILLSAMLSCNTDDPNGGIPPSDGDPSDIGQTNGGQAGAESGDGGQNDNEKFELVDNVTELVYETVDFMGGFTETYKIDFNENKVYRRSYLPTHVEGETAPAFELIETFDDEEEKRFFEVCSRAGFFGIDAKYETSDSICDGGSWEISLTFDDGTKKNFEGVNAGPYDIFNDCAVVFFDLCGEQVLGYLEEEFRRPPNLSTSLEYNPGNISLNERPSIPINMADHHWNEGRIVSDNDDIYAINEAANLSRLRADLTYSMVFYTSNYNNGLDYERFSKFTLKSYDYNKELTGEKLIAQSGWFTQESYELELNKIYVYELSFDNGDYVRYTFNTKLLDEPIAEITFERIDNESGEGKKYRIDLIENKAYCKEIGAENGEFELLREFTEDEEKYFIKTCAYAKLFKLEKEYELEYPSMAQESWELNIKYEDGTEKNTKGTKPEDYFYDFDLYYIFGRCSIPFYFICGEDVLGCLEERYTMPPTVTAYFKYFEDGATNPESSYVHFETADYSWNKKISDDKNYYYINKNGSNPRLDRDKSYTVEFSTVYYNGAGTNYPKFEKFTLISYDYILGMTNETVVLESGWFDTLSCEVELGKIYVAELQFENGDYVRYTFNTKTSSYLY